LVEALAVMCSQCHDWYTKPMLRMMAHGAASKIANKIQESIDNGVRPDFHPDGQRL
jgi:hypothetical protein